MSNTDFDFDQSGGAEIEVNVDIGAVIDANEDPNREVKPPADQPDLITRRTQQHDLAGLDDMRRQVKDLEKQNEESTRRANEANARLQETTRRASQEAAKSRQEAANSRKASAEVRRQAIDTAIQATDLALDAAEAELVAASDKGDSVAAAKANRKLAELAATRAENERRKEQVADEVEREKAAPAAAAVEEDVGGGPGESAFDKYLKQFTPKVQAWMRKHPDVVTDQKKNRLAFVAHDEAIDAGHEDQSDAYFQYLEKRLGYASDNTNRRQQNYKDLREETRQDPRNMSQQQQRQPPRASAPVSREGGIDGGRGSVRVRLTPGEIEHATNGITHVWGRGHPREGEAIGVEEMARRKAIMHNQGRYMNSDYQGG